MKKISFIIVLMMIGLFCNAQSGMTIDPNVPLGTLITEHLLAGCGTSSTAISSLTTTCPNGSAFFSNTNPSFPFASGLLISTGQMPNSSSSASCPNGNSVSPNLQSLAGTSINNVNVVKFCFTPQVDYITFDYIFASMEFNSFCNSSYNDPFGFFLSGPGINGPYTNGAVNIATLPNGQPVTINNVCANMSAYQVYPANNTTGFNGATIELTAYYGPIVPGQQYCIEFGIADASDGALNSAIFIETGSFIVTENGSVESITGEQITIPGGVSVGSPTTVLTCNNTSIQLQAQGGDIYEWSNGVQIFSDPAVATITQPGTYTVTITNSVCNVTETHDVTITQDISIPIAQISSPTTILNCHTESIVATASGGATYLWSGGTSPNTASNTFYLPGTYWVTVTGANGCTAKTSISFTFQEDMHIIDILTGDIACSGGTDGYIVVQYEGGFAPFQYLWNDGVNTLNRSNISAGNYKLTITDGYGCTLQETVTITQPPLLMITDTTYRHLSCFESNDGSIAITVNGGVPPYQVTWNDNNLSGLNRNNLAAGIYAVTITDAHHCFVMEQFVITQPELLNISTCNNQIICEGMSAIVQATAHGGTYPFIYYWSQTPTPNEYQPGLAERVVTPNTTTVYRVYIVDAKGCQSPLDSIRITVSPYIIIDTIIIKDNSCFQKCDGQAKILYHGGTVPMSFSWASPNNTLSNLCVGQYFVTLTDKYGCTADTTFYINEPYELTATVHTTDALCYGSEDGTADLFVQGGTEPYSYLWNNGATTNRITTSAANYEVTIYDANHCRLTVPAIISQPSKIISTELHSQKICYGQNVSMSVYSSGGTPPYYYDWTSDKNEENHSETWNVSPTVTTTYFVVVTDENKCKDTLAPVTITINDELKIKSITTSQQTICPGYDSEITVVVEGGNGGPYMMRLQNGKIVGSPFTVNPTETTTFYITVDDMCGDLPVMDSITIDVLPKHDINFIPSAYSGCVPLMVDFTAQSDYAFESYFWHFDNYAPSSEQYANHVFVESGSYDITLEATDAIGCIHTKTIKNMITVYPLPISSFSFTPDIATTVNPEVTFINHSTGASKYYWSFGDGDSSNNVHPIHTYMPSVNNYFVTLIAESNYNCRDTSYREIGVENLTALYFPNSFTPDGDEKNDCFKPCGNFISQKDFHLIVLDSFGEIVFESTKYDDTEKASDCSECTPNSWNGKMKNTGKTLPNGIYVWHCKYRDKNGIIYEKTGHVMLIR